MGGGQEPPDEKEDLKEKLAMLHVGVNYYELEDQFMQDGAMQPEFAARWASDVVKDIDKLADFILNLRKSESVNFEDSTPPLDTEELEKQMDDLLNTTVNLGGRNKNSQRLYVRRAKQTILALFAQHTQVAVDQAVMGLAEYDMDVPLSVDGRKFHYLPKWTLRKYLEQLEQRKKEE